MKALRIAGISLAPFGRFEEADFAFARTDGAPDLHLIVGRNEAGKTTLRHALVSLLFGVPAGSPYLYRSRRPRVSGTLEVDGEALAIRRSGTGTTAQPAENAARLADALAAMGATRATFLLTQAFSHADMRAHSEELRDTKGQLSKLLMRDAGGLKRAEDLLAELKKSEEELFVRDRRRSSTRARLLEAEWQKAEEAYVRAELEAPQYAALRRERDTAAGAVKALRLAHAEAVSERDRLARLIEAEPVVAELKALEAEPGLLGVAELAEGARDRVHGLVSDLAVREASLAKEDERAAELAARRAGLSLDDAALAAGETIDALAGRAAELRSLADERREARGVAEAAREAATALARQIGLGMAGADGFAAGVPPALVRREIAGHIARFEELRLRADHARERLGELDRRTPPAGSPGPSEALLSLAQRFEALGRFEDGARRLAGAEAEAAAALEAAMVRCAGDADCTAPPPPEDGLAAEQRIEAARRALERAEDTLRTAAEDGRRIKEEYAQKSVGDVPTPDRIAAARAERDGLWSSFAAGREPIEADGGRLSGLMARADGLADERFEKVEQVVAAEKAEAAYHAARARYEALARERDARRAELDRAEKAWAERLAALGLELPPTDYRAWHDRRLARIEAEAALRRAKAERTAFAGALASVVAAAAAHFRLDCEFGGEGDGEGLVAARALAERVRSAVSEAAEAAAAARQAAADYAKAQEGKPRLLDDKRAADEALAAWQSRWQAISATAGIQSDAPFETVRAMLEAFDGIERALEEAARAEARIARADAFEAALAGEVAAVAAQLGEPAVAGPSTGALDATLGRLAARLASAREVAATVRALDTDLAATGERCGRLREDVREARERMAPDLAAAGLPANAAPAALIEAARRSDARREAERRRQAALATLSRAGLGWPQVGVTIAGASEAERRAALEEAVAEADRLAAAERDAISAHSAAAVNLDRAEAASRPGEAADHRFRQHIIEAEIADAVAEAIERRMEALVLGAARDAYARENRSPILSRAAEIFRSFTAGAYDRLDAGEDPESFLTAHRAIDDHDVGVDGLSDGTRDQLVVSVRLAAAALSPLPFVADDLLVNADDERAKSGFEALSILARERQVFYLTHHDHLAEIARGAVGEGLTITRL